MSKPKAIDETWDADGKHVDLAGDTTPFSIGKFDEMNGMDEARAQLASCAPEALRMLESMEWAGCAQFGVDDTGEPCCPACGSLADGGKHEAGCALVAILKKAGLR